jgi:class 3 adenylate cyclase/uncharacterized protein HemY
MKKPVYFLALLFLPLQTLSQLNTDSLYQKWQDPIMEDSVRLHALSALVSTMIETGNDSALFLSDTLYIEGLKRKWKPLVAQALWLRGKYFREKDSLDATEENYQKSLAIYEELQYELEIATLLIELGDFYLEKHQYNLARQYLLKGIKVSASLDDKDKMASAYTKLGVNNYFQGDFSATTMNYFQKAIDLYTELGNKKQLAGMLSRTGAIYFYQGHYLKALLDINKYYEISLETGDSSMMSEAYSNMGAIYQIQKDYGRAFIYYRNGLALDEKSGNYRGVAINYFNLGECYQELGDYDASLDHFQKSLQVSIAHNEFDIIADAYRGIGLVYLDKAEYREALQYFEKSSQEAADIDNESIMGANYISQGAIAVNLGEYQKALNLCKKGLDISLKMGALKQQMLACDCLYKAYKQKGMVNQALTYHEQYILLSDSLQNEETYKKLQQIDFNRQQREDSLRQEKEKLVARIESQEKISVEKNRKNIFMYSAIVVLLVSIGLFTRNRHIRRSKAIIQKEKDRSDNLLLNILPSEVAEKMKEKGESIARDFNNVTVLFSDFKEFTRVSENLSAQALVAEINICFKAFDQIITTYGVEKIKTIGDSYMAAGGLNNPKTSSTRQVILAGLEMQAFMQKRSEELKKEGKPFFEMRVGIHTGPVVAGIVGVKKFQYDIWGDTVNIASRMESAGDVGKVNISESTYQLVKDQANFAFEQRGNIQVKGKGDVVMHFVELSQNAT